jgi:hypothetical protein
MYQKLSGAIVARFVPERSCAYGSDSAGPMFAFIKFGECCDLLFGGAAVESLCSQRFPSRNCELGICG